MNPTGTWGPQMPPPLPSSLPPVRPHVQNYLPQAILVTIFCCVPFGIPAIVFASQVNTRLTGGDVNGAMESSRKAKMWMWIAFGSGLAINLGYAVLMIVSGMSES